MMPEKHAGTVVRITHQKGFGFIRDEAGMDYFFHFSAITSGESLQDLVAGETQVKFLRVETPKGWRANLVEVVA